MTAWFDSFDSSQLRSLELSGNNLSYKLFAYLDDRYDDGPINTDLMISLKLLNLSHNNLDDRAMKVLARLLRSMFAKVDVLDLSYNLLSPRALKAIRNFVERNREL